MDAGSATRYRVVHYPDVGTRRPLAERSYSGGNISVPLIGDVQVAGLTTEEAQAVIEKRLIDGQFMLHPQVSVFAKEYATQGVSVLGEVQKPGIYPLLG